MLYRILSIIAFFALRSYSSVAQWVNTSSNTTELIYEVYFPAADTGYYVTASFGNGGKIFGTTDGQNFTQLYSDAGNYFLCAYFISSEMGWVGGGDIGSGIILKTDNGGLSWSIQTTACEQIESMYFVNETNGWAVANDGTSGTYFIYHTSDGGQNWSLQKTGIDYVRSVYFTSPQIGYVAGDNGRIFKTIDAGVNWNLLSTGVVFHFNDIQFISTSNGWAAGSYVDGGIFETTDAGLSWHRILTTLNTAYTSIAYDTPSYGCVAGENGVIKVTTDSGANWTSMSTGHTQYFSSLSFVDSLQGFATTDNGKVQRLGSTITFIPSTTGSTSLTIFPNPVNDQAILLLDKTSDVTQITITDVCGRIVLSESTQYANYLLDASEWMAGVYLVTISSGAEVYSSRFIVK